MYFTFFLELLAHNYTTSTQPWRIINVHYYYLLLLLGNLEPFSADNIISKVKVPNVTHHIALLSWKPSRELNLLHLRWYSNQ